MSNINTFTQIPSPLPVTLTSSTGATVVNTYDTVSSVASSTITTIVSYTVPSSETFKLSRVEASGNNIASYQVEIDGVVQAFKRTYWGSGFNVNFNFMTANEDGLDVGQNIVIRLRVTHERTEVGDFEGRILGSLV